MKMTTAQIVETSVTVNNNSPIHDYVHPDDQTQPTFIIIIIIIILCVEKRFNVTIFVEKVRVLRSNLKMFRP